MGRLLGLAFGLPLIIFALIGRIPNGFGRDCSFCCFSAAFGELLAGGWSNRFNRNRQRITISARRTFESRTDHF